MSLVNISLNLGKPTNKIMKKGSSIKKVLFLTIVVFSGLLVSCEKEDTVKYEVNCSPSGFDITYENSSGNTEQKSISSNSWVTTFTGNQGDFVYISAQAKNENATITVKISYQGDVIEEASSSGDYVIATASGNLP